MKSARLCSVLAALTVSGVATAETLNIDLFAEGAISEGLPLALVEHFVLTYDLGVGTTVDSVTWSLNRQAFSPSYLSEMTISFRDGTDGSGFVMIQEGPTNGGIDAIAGSQDPDEVLTTGELFIRFYETFDDSTVDPDGLYLKGSTLTIEYTPTCTGDFNGDGSVGFADLTQMLNAWGPCPGCPEDIDENDTIGFSDLTILLAAWGPCST
jgi:hypothetical protein